MSDWTESNTTVNGIRIHYHRTGGTASPLVLVHGYSDNGLCWMRLARSLEGTYDLIMPDARGHGLSEAPEAGYGTENMAADLAGLIEALKLGKPAVLGHSMGASTAATWAAQYPQQVGAVLLEDPPWFDEQRMRHRGHTMPSPEKRRAEILARKTKSQEELIASCRQDQPTWDEIEFGPWADAKRQLSPNLAGRMAAPRRPWQEVVSEIAHPTLLITADNSAGALVTPDVAAQAAELNPRFQTVHIAGAGHSIRREQFDLYVQAVTQFLDAVYSSR